MTDAEKKKQKKKKKKNKIQGRNGTLSQKGPFVDQKDWDSDHQSWGGRKNLEAAFAE